MAEFKQFTYTNNGTEIDFMQGLVDLICGLDDSITVEDENGNPTTVEEQYADTTAQSRHFPIFVFKFGGSKMTLRRNRWVGEQQSRFMYYPNYPATSPYVILDLAYNQYAYNAQATRQLFVSYYKSDNVIALWLGSYNVTQISNAGVSATLIKTEDGNYGAVVSGTNPWASSFIGDDVTVTYSPTFAYSAGAGNIDFIEKAVFVSGGAKAFETEEIKSCSTMPQFASIALPDGRNFFTIATNAMVEINTEGN